MHSIVDCWKDGDDLGMSCIKKDYAERTISGSFEELALE